jgi:hypothetical protein
MLATLIGTLGVALAQPVPAQAQVYTYQGLADTRPASQFVNFGPPAINDAGDVAFAANLKSGGSGIYKWSAVTHTLVTIFEDPSNDWLTFLNPFAYPALTRTGEVIFQVGDRIMAGSGGSVRPIADSSYGVPLASLPGPFECQQPTLLSRTATDDGEVVVACLVSDGGTNHGQGVYLADGGALQRVCDFVSLSAISNIFPRCFQEGPLEVSPSGVLAGIGLDPTRMDPFGFPRQILVRGTTNLEVLLDPGVHTALAFPNRMSHLGINDAGTVAFDAYQDAPGGTGFAIFRIDTAGVPISVTDPRNFVYRDATSRRSTPSARSRSSTDSATGSSSAPIRSPTRSLAGPTRFPAMQFQASSRALPRSRSNTLPSIVLAKWRSLPFSATARSLSPAPCHQRIIHLT